MRCCCIGSDSASCSPKAARTTAVTAGAIALVSSIALIVIVSHGAWAKSSGGAFLITAVVIDANALVVCFLSAMIIHYRKPKSGAVLPNAHLRRSHHEGNGIAVDHDAAAAARAPGEEEVGVPDIPPRASPAHSGDEVSAPAASGFSPPAPGISGVDREEELRAMLVRTLPSGPLLTSSSRGATSGASTVYATPTGSGSRTPVPTIEDDGAAAAEIPSAMPAPRSRAPIAQIVDALPPVERDLSPQEMADRAHRWAANELPPMVEELKQFLLSFTAAYYRHYHLEDETHDDISAKVSTLQSSLVTYFSTSAHFFPGLLDPNAAVDQFIDSRVVLDPSNTSSYARIRCGWWADRAERTINDCKADLLAALEEYNSFSTVAPFKELIRTCFTETDMPAKCTPKNIKAALRGPLRAKWERQYAVQQGAFETYLHTLTEHVLSILPTVLMNIDLDAIYREIDKNILIKSLFTSNLRSGFGLSIRQMTARRGLSATPQITGDIEWRFRHHFPHLHGSPVQACIASFLSPLAITVIHYIREEDTFGQRLRYEVAHARAQRLHGQAALRFLTERCIAVPASA
ncbi:MAG: hypothetical protein ACKVOH_01720 [Chlamydiales bacterium]